MKLKNIVFSASIVLASMNIGMALAETVEISGSTTVNSLLITPHKAEIERQSGHTLKINPRQLRQGSYRSDWFQHRYRHVRSAH